MSDVKKVKHKSSVKIGFIADDINNLNKFGLFHNATFFLMLACQKFNAKVLLCKSESLKVRDGNVFARFNEVRVKQEYRNHLRIIRSKECNLNSLDIIFIRKDPPVDNEYLSLIYRLCLLSKQKKSKTLIINNPEGILKANEKLYALHFPQITPPTIVTSEEEEAFKFLDKYKIVVVKPIFNKSGKGVFCLDNRTKNKGSIIKKALAKYGTIIVQKYLKKVLTGDKRIILLNGSPIGIVRRIPRKGEFRTNVCYGPKFVPARLKKEDLRITRTIKPLLVRDGLYFVGIDVIGKYLIEINLTCPATLQETSRAEGKNVAEEIVKWAIKKIS